jgi:hypothetical protein
VIEPAAVKAAEVAAVMEATESPSAAERSAAVTKSVTAVKAAETASVVETVASAVESTSAVETAAAMEASTTAMEASATTMKAAATAMESASTVRAAMLGEGALGCASESEEECRNEDLGENGSVHFQSPIELDVTGTGPQRANSQALYSIVVLEVAGWELRASEAAGSPAAHFRANARKRAEIVTIKAVAFYKMIADSFRRLI